MYNIMSSCESFYMVGLGHYIQFWPNSRDGLSVTVIFLQFQMTEGNGCFFSFSVISILYFVSLLSFSEET